MVVPGAYLGKLFLADKSMFCPRICRYSMGKLMTEVLKMVKKCKIY